MSYKSEILVNDEGGKGSVADEDDCRQTTRCILLQNLVIKACQAGIT